MFSQCHKKRCIVLNAICVRVILAIILNALFSFSTGDCALLINDSLNREQFINYQDHNRRIRMIVDLVFPDMEEAQKRSWAMLLLGTAAAESNFLDRYSGISRNGSGPYQIISETVYGVIHRYVTYPIKDSKKIAKREELIPLFAKATKGRLAWEALFEMKRGQLRSLCADDYDFAALISLLIYKEVFERKGISVVPTNPGGLATLWKRYYNTSRGVGTEKRFIQRFMSVHAYFV